MSAPSSRVAVAGGPQSLIETTFGLFAPSAGDWIPIGGLVGLIAHIGVESTAIRTAVSRMKQQGAIAARRRHGIAGYQLTEDGARILAEKRPRSRRAADTQSWVIVVFSVPEAERSRRHQLRSSLSRLGFGLVSAGVWIAPARLEVDAREQFQHSGLEAYVEIFRVDHVAYGDLRELVRHWWDLDALERMYRDFLDQLPRALRTVANCSTSPAEAFQQYLLTIAAWRRLPIADPGLPDDLLPPQWSGKQAVALVQSAHERLAQRAQEHFDEVCGARTSSIADISLR